jgi:hypothetical protein
MKQNLLWSAVALLAVSALAAETSSKDTVKNAAKKLAEQASYSWRTTVETASDSRFRPGPTEGKTEKGGFTCLAMTRGENTFEAVMKGEKTVIKTDEGWQTAEDLTASGGGGQGNPARFMARTLQNYKLPAAQLEDLMARVKDLALADGAYAGELTEEGVKQLLTFGRRAGAEPPPISNAKGSVKIWLKDGLPAKYEVKVQGTITFNNNDMNVDRTTVTEIKEVGKTKVEVPAEAKQKLS